jgi:sugar lactone lactonase YvrE
MTKSTLQPFSSGDVFAAATVLNDPNDDHAGRGRVIQYDANLREKAVTWLEETTHLVGGLRFDARGRLWAFDSHAHVVLVIHGDGRVERRDFGGRAFSHVNFARDGTLYLGEHVVGDTIKPEIQARLGTTISKMPGTNRFGDGHVFRFREDGTLIKEHGTQTHGGVGGFLGVTMSALSPDEKTLVYCSETGPRLMRYDLAGDRQLPDLQSFPEGQREMFFGMVYGPDGTLYVLRGARLDLVDEQGRTTRSIPLQGFGWATIAVSADGRSSYLGNFFTGELAKIDLASGEKLASAQTGGAKALAGVAEFTGATPQPMRKPPARRKAAAARRKTVARRKTARRPK